MSRRFAVFLVLLALLHVHPAIAAQDDTDSPPVRPRPAAQSARSNANAGPPVPAPEQSPAQPQIIVNPPAPPPSEWSWHDRVAWGAGIVLAVLGYVGVLLALRTLRSIDRHLEAGIETARAAMDSSNAALALAQAIASSERPWIVVTVEPFLTLENSFKVMASNRGRSPARIVASRDQVRIAVAETNLPPEPEFDKIEPGDEPEPIVLLPGEATGIWALNREDLATICKSPEVQRRVERWQETLFLYGRIQYMELSGIGGEALHETYWCCRYIHGEKNSALVMAGPPAYNKHT